MKYFFKQLRFVKRADILACFVFLFALPLSWIYKRKRKDLWLFCERSNEARDNGYWFYKYVCEQHPQQDVAYAIKFDSPDYAKVKELRGEVIKFGSLKHWIYYLVADINISSQKEGKPNAAVCHFLEIYGIRKNRRVYLKHGIVFNDLKWHYYDVTKMWLYICSTKQEYEFCLKKFGYPEEAVALTGLCRYDNLNNDISDRKTIFIMPTHREWLSHPIRAYKKFDNIFDFANTEYFQAWATFLEHPNLNQCIKDNNLNVVFLLHSAMQGYLSFFEKLQTEARIVSSREIDLQYMLKKAGLLITDYSSIHFDFAYMKKPVLYYQFDYEKFREGHYQEGYFSYQDDGFGAVCSSAEDLCAELCKVMSSGMAMTEAHQKRVDAFFEYRDSSNCERVYTAIEQRRKRRQIS